MDHRQLPADLPTDPMPYIDAWLAWARSDSGLRNPNAMALATADPHNSPSVRMVLLKSVDPQGFGVFYTHYDSPKSRDAKANPHGAGVLHWDALGRQLRLEGPLIKSPPAESDRYFASRPTLSQLNASVSHQSQPVSDTHTLEQQSARLAAQHSIDLSDTSVGTQPGKLPRPGDWGGYRLWFSAIELWAEGKGRFHDRIRFERELHLEGHEARHAGPWQATRLQP
jgi:pyridoxamine 5'-phosphate oxidase